MKGKPKFKKFALVGLLAVVLCFIGFYFWIFSQSEDIYPYNVLVVTKSPLVSMTLNGMDVLDQLEEKERDGNLEYSISIDYHSNAGWSEVDVSCQNKAGDTLRVECNTWDGRSALKLTLKDAITPEPQ